MKRVVVIFSILFLTGLSFSASAQRYCVIDSKYILGKIPAYTQAQKELDNLSKVWQAQVDSAMQKVDQMYKSYQAERPMLSEAARQKRESEIEASEKAAKDLQKKYFGYQGAIFTKRESLIKPIQDKVYNAVQEYAKERSYDIIYDKSGGITIFYADPKLDKSNDILKIISSEK